MPAGRDEYWEDEGGVEDVEELKLNYCSVVVLFPFVTVSQIISDVK